MSVNKFIFWLFFITVLCYTYTFFILYNEYYNPDNVCNEELQCLSWKGQCNLLMRFEPTGWFLQKSECYTYYNMCFSNTTLQCSKKHHCNEECYLEKRIF